jgi:uncharacterized protein (TIGR03435 family)
MRIFALVLGSMAAFGQPAFEVASIKPQPWTGQRGSVGVFVRGDTLDGEHVGLNDLVAFAYNLRGFQLTGGPAWGIRGELASSVLYQVTAKATGDPPPPIDQFRRMLQTLLADRFHLQVHHVSRDFPTYNLVVAKGGPRLKESSNDAQLSTRVSSRGKSGIRIETARMTMPELVDNQLSGYSGRPVFDKTGIAGSYGFVLEFVVDNLTVGPDDASAGPSLFTALQDQLGLRLETSTAAFDTVVIDHAEKPSDN